jgi:hypothetical protein
MILGLSRVASRSLVLVIEVLDRAAMLDKGQAFTVACSCGERR